MRLIAAVVSTTLSLAWPWPSTGVATAAVLTRCELVVDGSTDPPGDRIDCEATLVSGETVGAIEVRAFVVEGSSPAQGSPVRSLDPRIRAPDGALVIRVALKPADDPHSARQSIVIPYAALDLARGSHLLGYVVTLFVGERTVWTQPLALTAVTIGDAARLELRPRSLDVRPGRVDQLTRAAIGDGRQGRDVEQRSVRLRSSPPEASRNDRIPAKIERGFERSPIKERVAHPGRLADLADQPWRPAADVVAANERIVRFATNRVIEDASSAEGSPKFLNARGPLTYGECRVNFPVRFHRRGQLERPSWWNSLDPEKHFFVESTRTLDASEVFANLGNDDVLLFVHGFANQFEDGVMCAAQLATDVDFGGRAIAFSWPSLGAVSQQAYTADAAMAQQSIDDLADLLDKLTAQRSGAQSPRVHLIAHSMGNKIALQAIYRLIDSGRWEPGEKRLGQVVLAAPDVGAALFNNLLDHVLGASERVTYYYYSRDLALDVSQQVNRYEPVGKFPYFENGLDTINVDGSGTNFLGHSYYSSSLKVLVDLELLLKHGYAPDRRIPPLGAKTRVYGHDHWSFLPLSATESGGGG